METNMSDTALLLRAISFAADKHRNQRRKNKESTPYINHPIRVCSNIAEIGGVTDVVPLVAAVLHDTIEDTDTTYEEIKYQFGKEIADVVVEVTDNKSLSKVERKKLQVIRAPHKSHAAKLVKLSDKLDNLSDLLKEVPKGWSREVAHGYFVWSYKVVEGLRGTNSELESVLDTVFKQVIDPRENIDISLEKYYASL
jgi:guanosine-3',5'-bis(diphosphate) 3'-pyrophosphohydrolase